MTKDMEAAEPHFCPNCRTAGLASVPVIHHMICAYVGPDYDYGIGEKSYLCPKCRRGLWEDGGDWEIIGSSLICGACRYECVWL